MKIPEIVEVFEEVKPIVVRWNRAKYEPALQEAISILKKIDKLKAPEEKAIDKNRSADDRRYPIGYNACLKQWKAQIEGLKC